MTHKSLITLTILLSLSSLTLAVPQNQTTGHMSGGFLGYMGMRSPAFNGGKVFYGGRQVYPVAGPGQNVIQYQPAVTQQPATNTGTVGIQHIIPRVRPSHTQGQNMNIGLGQNIFHVGPGSSSGAQFAGANQSQGYISPWAAGFQNQSAVVGQIANVTGGIGSVRQNAVVNMGQFQQHR
jgi:hypothetical protein